MNARMAAQAANELGPEHASEVSAYLDRLPLSQDEKIRLRAAAGAGAEALSRLHRALGEAASGPSAGLTQCQSGVSPTPGPSAPPQEAAATASIAARLRMAWAGRHRRGDEEIDRVVQTDRHGRTRLVTTPPLARASMTPRPWATNPFTNVARGVQARFVGKRGLIASRHGDPVIAPAMQDSPDPKGHWQIAALWRRLVLLSFVLGQTWFAVYFMTAILPYHGGHWLEKILLVVYAILFAWVGAGFWTALMGFWVLLWGRDRYSISGTVSGDPEIGTGARTAILMPICNEDVPRVIAGLRATYDSVMRTGAGEHFDFFILSDTNNADTRVAELEAWLRLCREVDGFGRIHYRRRTHRIKRKSGNVADWCRRWGSRYRYMVVLDADSVMSGPCLKRLVQLMEANPNAGIIQTAPRAAGRETLYARIQQFATRVYGPLFTAGLHFWQLGESHYWGHNAILRVAPFMRHCALGRIPGRGALAGEILSHDFVEAALMRRAGWAVWIAYDLPGSYEEMPPNLLDELKRDRRWCQGNLQNFKLFTAQGLHPAHRAVFMTGVMAYLSAPLWFLFLVLSTALLAVNTVAEPVYFTEPYQLFPIWPEWHPEWAIRLFGATATLLFLPKLLAALLLLFKPRELRGFGGGLRVVLSVFLESLFSALLAPIRMLFHTRFVLSAMVGWAIQWKSPARADSATAWREALWHHAGGTALGLVWAAGVYQLDEGFLWWLLPVVGSLVLAIPLSVLSSRVQLGRRARAHRLFLIPEESMPPRELRWTRAALRRAPTRIPDFRGAVVDPLLNAMVAAHGTPRAAVHREEVIGRALDRGAEHLTDADRNSLLSDPLALSRLHALIWQTPELHKGWRAD